ncbi:MAG: hypothetical protein HY682_06435 [Chloroflexi bacterium]|nr:hypothetical protein [Chloroflexota bacterium]
MQGALARWSIEDVDTGIKPALDLAGDGSPHVAYMVEKEEGYVRHAFKPAAGTPGRWIISTVAEGYFYGPLDTAVDPDGNPRIVYHDHQDVEVRADLGNLAYAVKKGDGWEVNILDDPGHDGWDGSMVIDHDGVAHIAAIDPKDFAGSGVEYYRVGAEYHVERIGSGPQTYRFATTIALDPVGTPHIAYYDEAQHRLMLARRTDQGWELEDVDSEGDSGMFSSMVIDRQGRIHISYFRKLSDRSGAVLYATRAATEEAWTVQKVDELDHVFFGGSWGARKLTSVAVAPDGTAWIAYGDQSRVAVARLDGDAWTRDTIATSTDVKGRPLGHLVSLKLDRDGRPRLVFWELTSFLPLEGIIRYVAGSPG